MNIQFIIQALLTAACVFAPVLFDMEERRSAA